jgi:CubicO group peptidase (beta-lactamase class C family)
MLRLLGSALLLSVALPYAAQDDLGGRVDALFARWDRSDSPGASVSVVHKGEVIFSDGYGLASLEQGTHITPDTIFHVASVSKQFTAFALCLLADEGALGLDDPVRAHLAEVPDFGAPLTLRHMLHHTSGLRDQWEGLAMAGWRLDDVITTQHVLTFVEHQKELNFPSGSEHLYCNTGYTLAGQVVARVSGESFPEFCRGAHLRAPRHGPHPLP